MPEKFDVWFTYPDGTQTKERSGLGAEEAVKFASQATQRPAAKIGILTEVKIVDEDDYTNFHWEYGKGVTFPPRDPKTGLYVESL